MVLPFFRSVLEDLVEDDGLVVLAQGLGLHKALAPLVRVQQAEIRTGPNRLVVVIIGCNENQRRALERELLRHDPAAALPEDINNEYTSDHRLNIYKAGGCIHITTRICIVDLLCGRLLPDQVAGLVVANAHRITDNSGEGFVCRLFRAANRVGFVRGFTDAPRSMSAGFNKAERVMKALFVRKLFLWPRFQLQVSEVLEAVPPEVIELHQPVTHTIMQIEAAILDVMGACLQELKRSSRVDSSDLTIENGLFKSFDDVIRRQLDPIWHTVGRKTKQIVDDLRTLRKLAGYLLRYDAVRYLMYLEALRATAGVNSVWLYAGAAHTIFEAAKRRVYVLRDPNAAAGGKAKTASKKRKKGDGGAGGRGGGGRGGGADGGREGAEVPVSGPAVLEPVLEPLPKWRLLGEIMEEIQEERDGLAKRAAVKRAADVAAAHRTVFGDDSDDGEDEGGDGSGGDDDEGGDEDIIVIGDDDSEDDDGRGVGGREGSPGAARAAERKRAASGSQAGTSAAGAAAGGGGQDSAGGWPVLIVARDDHTRQQLEVVLREGAATLMERQFEKYLKYRQDLHKMRGRRQRRGAGGARGAERAAELQRAVSQQGGREGQREEQALLAVAEETVGPTPAAGGGRGGGRGRGRGRGARGGGRAGRGGGGRGGGGVPAPGAGLAGRGGESPTRLGPRAGDDDGEGGGSPPPPPPRLMAGVHVRALDKGEPLMDELRPTFVVVYDPSLEFIREVEVYRAEHPGGALRVYCLWYDNSLEEQKYNATVAREKDAFENLIKNKSTMLVPVSSDGKHVVQAPAPGEVMPLLPGAEDNSRTRRAGGRAPTGAPRDLVVDMREFMSKLPSVLHQQGMGIHPCTLEVGDYVLSPEICVERKSLPDLFQSFSSGRLFHQAEAMCRFYKTPVLLIEFEQDKSFSLQSAGDLGEDISQNSVVSKIVLLLLHFPKLRVVWSRSLHATADIFRALKSNQDEPDMSVAAAVGLPPGEGGEGGTDDPYNQGAVDLLRRLPGVTDANYRSLMASCESLAELASLPLDRLQAAMGTEKQAKALRDFLDAEFPV